MAAAAQLQAAQQQGSPTLPSAPQNPWETQLQLLKMQQQMANIGAVQQAARNSHQNVGFNLAAAAAAQAANANIRLPTGGGNDMTAVFAAMMASGANPAAVLAYQQHLAQVAMFNQMNAMNMGNLSNVNSTNNANNEKMANKVNNTNSSDNSSNSLGSAGNADKKVKVSPNKSLSLSDSITSIGTVCSDLDSGLKRTSDGGLKRKSAGGLNSSFTRAQRIGLKNSLTQRRPNRHLINADMHNSMNSTLKNSLMSIETLTLDDIDSSGFDGAKPTGDVFEDSDQALK